MATFMERCIDFNVPNGKWGMINMQSWMFLGTYETLRTKLIEKCQIDSLLHLGPRTFDEISGEVVQNTAFIFSNHFPYSHSRFYKLTEGKNCTEKETSYLKKENEYIVKDQIQFTSIPASVMGYWASPIILQHLSEDSPLEKYAYPRVGMFTGDNGRFIRNWWEVETDNLNFNCCFYSESKSSLKKWFPYNKGGSSRKWNGNYSLIVNYAKGGHEIYDLKEVEGRNCQNYPEEYKFIPCITWSTAAADAFRFQKQGVLFDTKGMCMFNVSSSYPYLLGFLNSNTVTKFLEILSPGTDTQVGHIRKLPFIERKDPDVETIAKENIFISNLDWDAHETSWDFQTNELVRISKEKSVNLLHSILAYYKREWEEKFFKLHENEEELNRKFIDIYGLQEELTPDVPLNEVTILQKGEKSIEDDELVWHDDAIVKQFISYLVGCFMGRYSIERPGLIIANQGQKLEDLDFDSTTIEIDDDGIIPIIQEPDFFADDMTYRVEKAVEALFGKENKEKNIRFIENALGDKLRDYFFKKYYGDHTEMYSVKGAKRPIYWLFNSKMGDKKKKGYFKALVYMHRMESDTLSKLHADYAVHYLNKLERQFRELEDELSRDDLPNRKKILSEAEELRGKIREVKEFTDELAKMASHRMTIDLDDGVAVNYPKFYPLLEPIKGLDTKDD